MAATALADAPVMEARKLEYFSSINSMARKIMQEREKIKERFGPVWDEMSPQEQDSAIDDGMMDQKVRARYSRHRVDREEVLCYPKLLLQTGQKIVHFGEEDLTWQDEHSAPFSWETKSQLEFSVITGAPESIRLDSVSESKPRTSQSRRDEESSFWKISAERSRLEGEKADFQSLTPSQIKSLEKGEKPLPSYLRSDGGEEPQAAPPPLQVVQAPRSVKQRAPKPPAPPPPPPSAPISLTPVALNVSPAPISVTPATLSVSPAPVAPSGGWERSQSTLPSASSPVDEVFSPGLTSRPPARPSTAKDHQKKENSPASSPTFSQFNTSSSILKTGFDFLDNW